MIACTNLLPRGYGAMKIFNRSTVIKVEEISDLEPCGLLGPL